MATVADTLDRELKAYTRLLPTLAGEEGRYAVIADDAVHGVFDTYSDAMKSAYEKLGLRPFLVKQIATIEVVANFTRMLSPVCHISL